MVQTAVEAHQMRYTVMFAKLFAFDCGCAPAFNISLLANVFDVVFIVFSFEAELAPFALDESFRADSEVTNGFDVV